MSANHAIVVDPSVKGRLALQEVASPTPLSSEALVHVAAISLNLGEVRRSTTAEAGWRPGWDFAGTVEQQAADGSGPRQGARVVGMLGVGAWAEVIAAPTNILAELPDTVTFSQAATLPVAGLTAYRALEKGGFLVGKRVLITGASGGVGHFAVQLANIAGSQVIGVARRAERIADIQQAGAHQVIVSEDLEAARQSGPYHLILDAVGGKVLGNALSMLAPGGTAVSYGSSSGHDGTVTFESRGFYLTGGAHLYGFILFHELVRKAGAEDLGILARLIAEGRLHPSIDLEVPWTHIADAVQSLLERRITGKAVLTL
jgi:NADPH:quinone reductase-like Zn-dependent oxidoreductase